MKIKGKAKSGELDIKRFYLGGVKITGRCPDCGADFLRDFGGDYLSYPDYNKPMDVTLCCPACDWEWDVQGRLNISLELL